MNLEISEILNYVTSAWILNHAISKDNFCVCQIRSEWIQLWDHLYFRIFFFTLIFQQHLRYTNHKQPTFLKHLKTISITATHSSKHIQLIVDVISAQNVYYNTNISKGTKNRLKSKWKGKFNNKIQFLIRLGEKANQNGIQQLRNYVLFVSVCVTVIDVEWLSLLTALWHTTKPMVVISWSRCFQSWYFSTSETKNIKCQKPLMQTSGNGNPMKVQRLFKKWDSSTSQ